MLKRKLFILGILTTLVFAFTLASCQVDLDNPGLSPPSFSSLRTYNESVQKVNFTGDTATVSFDSLRWNDIYLVKVNTSSLAVPAASTGHIQDFNANPPPIASASLRSMVPRQSFIPPQTGEERSFWVEDYFGSGRFVQGTATLRAAGKHGNIWVMNGNRRIVTGSQAQTLAERFDLIYPLVTNLLGHEYGGGPGGNGGRDGDPKIQILVYDIVDENVGQGWEVNGFFWAKDFYTQRELDQWGFNNIKTNMAEIFYLNAVTLINAPEHIYTALVHELQHMINFNLKAVRHGRSSETWFDEMLAMMTEDLISPLIGISPESRSHPLQERIPVFLESYYRAGVTEWDSGAAILDYYAVTYAFGAYLLRNFGGPVLLREILANSNTGTDSISAALQKVSGVSFGQSLSRFGEAMLFGGSSRPAGTLSFDNTVSSTVGGTRYTAHSFDIWSMQQWPSNDTGPRIFGIGQMDIRPHSVMLHSTAEWLTVSGAISITLERPEDPAIELYLMVR